MLVYGTKQDGPRKLLFSVFSLLVVESSAISLDFNRHRVYREVKKPKLSEAIITFTNVTAQSHSQVL